LEREDWSRSREPRMSWLNSFFAALLTAIVSAAAQGMH
jgi:hypothetical protein